MAEEWSTEDMLGTYLFENTQLLENLQGIVLEQQDADCFDEDSINEIFRTMHTIKGSSAIMKFDGITKTAHKLEDIFFCLRESHPQNVPHMELITHVLDVADFISGELEKIQDGGEADGDAAPLIEELEQFLSRIKSDAAEAPQEKNQEKTEKTQEQQRIYIPPRQADGSHFFILSVEYQPKLELANIHAFKLVHKLKEIAENINFFPEDILTSEESAKVILEKGFRIFLQTQKEEQELRDMISLGYDIKEITITGCSMEEFKEGLESMGVEICSRDSVKAEQKMAPGDFVIKPQKKEIHEPPEGKEALQAVSEFTDEGYVGILAELTARLECIERIVINNPDLKVPGLALDRFQEATCFMSSVSSDIRNTLAAMGAVFPEEEEVEKEVTAMLGYNKNEQPKSVVPEQNPGGKFEEETGDGEEETLRNKYMTFMSGNECFGFRISYVTEVIIYQSITRMPECPDYVKGIIHLRGKVVPVIDVRMRFGQESLEYNDKTCIIVISYGEHMIGLAVEKIADVVELPKDKLLPPPKVGWTNGTGNQFVYAVGRVDGSIKLLIDPKRLIPDQEMEAILQRKADDAGIPVKKE